MKYCKVALPVPLRREFDYALPPGAEPSPGARVRAPFGPRALTGFVTSVSDKTDAAPGIRLREIYSVEDARPLWPAQTLLPLARHIAGNWASPPGQVLDALVPSFVRAPGADFSAASAAEKSAAARPPEFSREQQDALAELESLLRAPNPAPALLFGESLSGKTAIAAELMRRMLKNGGQGLMLLPDIALTGRLVEEIAALAGNIPVYCWHSRQGRSKREKIWHEANSGRDALFLGTRSACLLPFGQLRLAVIDEEQDDVYKQEESHPHYHAREVLAWRARREGFALLLASSAPSAETMRAAVDGAAGMVRLKGRAAPVCVKIAPKRGAASPAISDELKVSLEKTLAGGGQALLILNRIGFSGGWSCLNCGWLVRCAKCARSMAFDQARTALFCGHCGARQAPPEKCPQCANRIFKTAGSGTSRAASELKKLLPSARILRFDRETLRLKSGEGRLAYDAMREDAADIVVATRLLARGYFFPRLRLSAVLDSDTELYGPDFRGAERTCQLLIQTKGRLANGGEFIAQTAHPQEQAIAAAAGGGYMEFIMREFEARKDMGYPPYSRLVRVLAESADGAAAEAACQIALETISKTAELCGWKTPEDYEIAGPAQCYTPKTSKMQRWHLLVKCRRDSIAPEIPPLFDKKPKSVRLRAICDPYSFR
ncbi:MAG: primosomal protein N' [Elusimicrobiales bacterium]